MFPPQKWSRSRRFPLLILGLWVVAYLATYLTISGRVTTSAVSLYSNLLYAGSSPNDSIPARPPSGPIVQEVHVIWRNESWFQFRHLIALLSYSRYLSPSRIYLHYSKELGEPRQAEDEYTAGYHDWLLEAKRKIHNLEFVEEANWGNEESILEELQTGLIRFLPRIHTPAVIALPHAIVHQDLVQLVATATANTCFKVENLLALIGSNQCTVAVLRGMGSNATAEDRPEGYQLLQAGGKTVSMTMPSHTLPRDFFTVDSVLANTTRDLFYGSPQRIQLARRHPRPRAPLIAHLIWFGSLNLSYVQMVAVRSAFTVAGMKQVMVHGDREPFGSYWDSLKAMFKEHLIHRYLPAPNFVWSKRITHVYHQSDIVRVELLRRYGGLYMDFDSIATRNMEDLFYYDAVIGKDFFSGAIPALQTSVLISAPYGEFVNQLLEIYRAFDSSKWNHQCCVLPMKVFEKFPHSVRIEPLLAFQSYDKQFAVHLWKRGFKEWKQYYMYHFIDPDPDPVAFYDGIVNGTSLAEMKTSFGDIIRKAVFSF